MIKSMFDISLERKYCGIEWGKPGSRKTSLAMSAPRPCIIDLDQGIHRVDAKYRHGLIIQPQAEGTKLAYESLLDDLSPNNPYLREVDTLVFDTGGALLDCMKAYAIKKDAKNGQSDGATLSMRGFGFCKGEFQRLMRHCNVTLFKHVIIIFHATEDKDGDVTRFRLAIEGGTKDAIWRSMDFGFFMEPVGNDIVCGFAPTERYDAKRTRGIPAKIKLTANNTPSDAPDIPFFNYVFSLLDKSMKEDAEASRKYNESVNAGLEIVNAINSAESATKAVEDMKAIDFFGDSKEAVSTVFKQKVYALGLAWDKEAKAYISKPDQDAAK